MPNRPALERKRGVELLHDSVLNKGTAFTEVERDALGLRGPLPPRASPTVQAMRVLNNFRRKPNDLEKYIYWSRCRIATRLCSIES